MWLTQYRCVRCESVLTFGQMMRSHGTCPLCGHHSKSTMVDCTSDSVEVVEEETVEYKEKRDEQVVGGFVSLIIFAAIIYLLFVYL